MRKKTDIMQIKAARAMLDWSQQDLADNSSISIAAIRQIELNNTNPRASTIEKIQKAFEDNGIEFIQSGLRLQDKTITRLEGEEPYLELLQDVRKTLKSGGELLNIFADESQSSDEIIEMERLIRKAGVKMRTIVREGDTFLLYPIEEYRYIPKKYFKNRLCIIYGNKIALDAEDKKVILIINSADLAETQRNIFNALWDMGEMPRISSAQKRYV